MIKLTPDQVEEILSYPTCKVEEAALVLGISRQHAYQCVHAGDLPVIRVGHRMLVRTATLRRMLADPVPAA